MGGEHASPTPPSLGRPSAWFLALECVASSRSGPGSLRWPSPMPSPGSARTGGPTAATPTWEVRALGKRPARAIKTGRPPPFARFTSLEKPTSRPIFVLRDRPSAPRAGLGKVFGPPPSTK